MGRKRKLSAGSPAAKTSYIYKLLRDLPEYFDNIDTPYYSKNLLEDIQGSNETTGLVKKPRSSGLRRKPTVNDNPSLRLMKPHYDYQLSDSASSALQSDDLEASFSTASAKSQRRSRAKGCDEDFGSVTLDVVNCTARVKEIWREMQTLLQKDQNNSTNQSLNPANGSDLDSSEQVDDRYSCRKLLFLQEIVHLPDASDKNGESFHKEKGEFLHEIKGIGSRASCQDASENLYSNNKMNEVNSISERIPELLDSEDQEMMKSVAVSPTSLDNTVFGIDGIELKKRDETVRDENSEDERPEAKMRLNIFIERSKSEMEIAKVVIESGVCSSDGIYNNEDKESVSQYEEHVTQADEIDLEDDSDHDFQWQPDSDSESEKGENAEMSTVWKTMNFAFESCKVNSVEKTVEESTDNSGEECTHSFVRQDDIGIFCKHCGYIEVEIEKIFDLDWQKSRCYKISKHVKRGPRELLHFEISEAEPSSIQKKAEVKNPEPELDVHPRYREVLKSHQNEGFEFLKKNLIGKEHGCILAHAPGTGKTFLVISFIQSFLSKYPEARPMVVAPKTILTSWKKEFEKWEVEVPVFNLMDIPNVEETTRGNQLKRLREWKEKKSILLISYHQFSFIVCEATKNSTTKSCTQLLLECPGLLILDEGHFPRNKDTNILQALSQIKTRKRILLSGTLFQNNFQELFNLFRLVRPAILELNDFQEIFRCLIESMFATERCSKFFRRSDEDMDQVFSDVVENLLKCGGRIRKDALCKLRKLIALFVHYYKGQVLQDLPGLYDYTVKLKLSAKQELVMNKYRYITNRMTLEKHTALICTHPILERVENSQTGFSDMLSEIRHINPDEGVKTKFVLDMVNLCETTKEKMLVFSQYLPSLDLLENILVHGRKFKKGSEVLRLDGQSSLHQRETLIDQFNTDVKAKILFASIRALGEGISLTSATRVIILDIPWNPSITRQAISRAYRIGQKGKVFSYRLVAVNTLDEEICHKSTQKERNAKLLFDLGDAETSEEILTQMNFEECEDMFLQDGSPLRKNMLTLYKHNIF